MTIREILDQSNAIAVVGASRDPMKTAGAIPPSLLHHGFHVIPVNPHAASLYGVTCYPALEAIPEPVDVVLVFRPSESTPPIARAAVAIHARVLWLQSGIVSADARRIAEDAGLVYVEDRCFAVERARYAVTKIRR